MFHHLNTPTSLVIIPKDNTFNSTTIETTIMMTTTTMNMANQYSMGIPSNQRIPSVHSASKRNDEWAFTCSYVLAWVGICMYFGGLNNEKWL